MKKNHFLLSFMTLSALISFPVEGKDGKGRGDGVDRKSGHHVRSGGDGGGRSHSGGERSIQRHQSTNRTSRQSRPNVSVPQGQSSTPQIHRSNISRPQSQHSQSTPRVQTRNQVQQFMKHSTPSRQHHGDSSQRNERHDGKFRNEGRHIRDQVGSNYHHRKDWFNRQFWDRHHYRPSYYSYDSDWWLPATSVGIGTWLGWQDQPYYYDSYEDFGYAAYPSGHYEDSSSVQPQIIPSMPLSDEWMPLGVFIVATNGRSVTTPNMFIQLALKKNGEIAGTYYNAILDQNYELEGMVNPETKLAAWKISNNIESPVFQTGIYNLSQEEVPIRVYFQNNTTQDWLLVRLEN